MMHMSPGCTSPAVSEKGTAKIPMDVITHRVVKKAFAGLWFQNTPFTRKRKRRVLRQPATAADVARIPTNSGKCGIESHPCEKSKQDVGPVVEVEYCEVIGWYSTIPAQYIHYVYRDHSME